MTAVDRYDVVGIGLGPSNLSLAALADPVDDLRAVFLERAEAFAWHPGMLFRGAELQVSFLKDLVTLVDPTSPHSFLNFLAQTGRLYRFVVLADAGVTRREYAQYYRWVADRLPSVRFASPVDAVAYDPGLGFTVWSRNRPHLAQAIVVGTGQRPSVPLAAAAALGATVLHSSEFLLRGPHTAGRRVLVVGGGQSGAEVVLHLLADGPDMPAALAWVSRRRGFLPLDDSPFTNEWFNPRYVEYFQTLAQETRRRLLAEQHLASDGVSEDLLVKIYRRLYEIDFLDEASLEHQLLPGRELVALSAAPTGDVAHRATLRGADTDQVEELEADIVVLATGYRASLPGCLDGMVELLATDRLDASYRLDWAHADRHDIFVQNGGRLSHGIADPNLSLASWRAATILNALCAREVHATGRDSAAIGWTSPAVPAVSGATEVLA